MQPVYQHLGWIVSPYSQKTLAYLKYKNIPHTDRAPNLWELSNKIPKRVGKSIMPTMQTPDGEWWQDSSDIIDKLEARYPEQPIVPAGPKQRITAHLLEMHGDEWLVLSALHYRWSRPGNARFIVNEFARLGVPWLPGFIGRLAGKRIRNMMKAYLPRFGIVGDTQQGLESFTEQLLERLNTHFQDYDYLLGGRPCIGDFALFGQIYAHLYRDPESTPLFDNLPHLVKWIERLLNPDQTHKGEFLANDEIPATLTPILKTLFAEQFSFAEKVVAGIDDIAERNPQAKRVSRIIGEASFKVGGVEGKRCMFSFWQWKVQRAWDVLHNLPAEQQQPVKAWLTDCGGEALINLQIRHRIERKNNREILVTAG